MAIDPIFIFNVPLIVNGDMSGNITSNSIVISEINVLGAQFVWSGGASPLGYVGLAFSNDNITFTPDPETFLSVSGNSGSDGINYLNIGFAYCQLIYVATSGSGTLNARLVGKRT
jgi:hypothetical protein